ERIWGLLPHRHADQQRHCHSRGAGRNPDLEMTSPGSPMRVYDLIQKKRDGGELTADEISMLLSGYAAGEIPDYQMSAFLMAVFFRGMSLRETADFTMAMVRSGETLDLSAIRDRKSTRLNSSHVSISYAVFCLKKKKKKKKRKK